MFISRYIDALEQEARQNGYNLEINTFQTSDIHEAIAHIKDANIEGLIVLGTELEGSDLEPFERIDIPLGFIDTRFNFKKFDFVDMDNIQAASQIVQHFIEHGHKNIGFIGSSEHARNFKLRHLGFQEALKFFGIPHEEMYTFFVSSTFDGAYRDMLDILKKGAKLPSAIFCVNDLIAYGCIKALKEINMRVPDDVSVIGFDDLPMSAMMDPPLTTLKVSQRQIGRMAIQLLLERIYDDITAPTIKISIGGRLICRKSVKSL